MNRRVLYSFAIVWFFAVPANAQPLPLPTVREFQQPGPFPQSGGVEIHRTVFAIEQETSVPGEPTASPPIQTVPIGGNIELEGELKPPQGEFSRYRYVAGRGVGGFALQSLETGHDWSGSWWNDCWAEGTTRLRANLGLDVHWWEGPKTEVPEAGPHLPSRVYDLYVNLLWQERWTDDLMTDVMLTPGLFTDFKTTPPQAFRLRGHAVAVLTTSHHFQLVGGIDYINRNDIKLLPVVGVLWRPHEESRLHLVFPQPKISHRLGTRKGVEYWGFVAGEYGGGAWTYKDRTESHDHVEYSDYRLIAGIEIMKCGERWPSTTLELGYVWNRELRLGRQTPDFEPKDTFFVGMCWTH